MHQASVPAASFSVRVMAIVWPSFLMAGVLEMLVFSLIDPADLHWFGGPLVGLSATAIYSLAFLMFWGVMSTASAMTQLLVTLPPDSVDEPGRHRYS